MKCPASVTITGTEFVCNTEHALSAGRHAHFLDPRKDSVVLWEQVVTPPEREWQPGDVVRDAAGFLFVATTPRIINGATYSWIWGNEWKPSHTPRQPLTRLVPEREPVDLDALLDVIRANGGGVNKNTARAVCEHLGIEVTP